MCCLILRVFMRCLCGSAISLLPCCSTFHDDDDDDDDDDPPCLLLFRYWAGGARARASTNATAMTESSAYVAAIGRALKQCTAGSAER